MVIASDTEILDKVWGSLVSIADPEIPAISIVDLGIVESVDLRGDEVTVVCLPTFVSCPALDVIRRDVEGAITRIGLKPDVKFVMSPAWTTDRITPEGRRKLLDYGLVPPSRSDNGKVGLALISPGRCPYCGSGDTILESPFGPTLCRATCYCRSCRNPYERFKPV